MENQEYHQRLSVLFPGKELDPHLEKFSVIDNVYREGLIRLLTAGIPGAKALPMINIYKYKLEPGVSFDNFVTCAIVLFSNKAFD